MAKAKETGPKQILEREYIVPLRKGWLKVPDYKRANKAVKTLKEFLVKHMKVYDRDLRKIKIEIDLNNEIRFRGMKKPPAKIKVKAIKYDDGNVSVHLVDIPDYVKYKRIREEKAKVKEIVSKTVDKPKEPKTEEESKDKKESLEDNVDNVDKEVKIKEKKESIKEESLAKAKMQAKDIKHVAVDKSVKVQRKALSK